MNNKLAVGGMFCNLEKAFDCIKHNILLPKLEFCGIVGIFNALVESYLKERYQRVLIDNRNTHNSTCSGWEKVMRGVPPGSVLGPLFFSSLRK
jgi:hypothetical protein